MPAGWLGALRRASQAAASGQIDLDRRS